MAIVSDHGLYLDKLSTCLLSILARAICGQLSDYEL
jgi:hypothetical protein